MIQEWLEGQVLCEALPEPGFDPRNMESVAEALAELHRQQPDGMPSSADEIEKSLAVEAAFLGRICPGMARRAEKLAGRIASGLANQPAWDRSLHGDFHARQVVLGPYGAALLDLDRACRGNPLTDLACFRAHLEREVIRGALKQCQADLVSGALLEYYAAATCGNVASRLAPFFAAELFRLAPRFFRYWESNWPQKIETLLDRAETALQNVLPQIQGAMG